MANMLKYDLSVNEFFNKNGFSIKYPSKIDMPRNKETKPNRYILFHF